MNVLEKILEEISEVEKEYVTGHKVLYALGATGMATEISGIIRSHMDEVVDMHGKRLIDANALDDEVTNFFLAITGNPKQTTVVRECKESFRRMIDEQPTVYANNGWIPVSEKLPEVGKMVKVTVHSSEWIADYDSDWVPEEEKTHHPEEYNVYDGYIDRVGMWRFYDEEGSVNACDKEFGTNKGIVYDVVTAWMPKEQPGPYKEE